MTAVLVATRPAPPSDTLGDIPADQWLAASGPLALRGVKVVRSPPNEVWLGLRRARRLRLTPWFCACDCLWGL